MVLETHRTQTRIRPVDGAARGGRASSPRQVQTGNPVRVVLEPASLAPEQRLALPVRIADEATPWTGLGGVGSVDIDHRDAPFQSLIFDVALESPEGPRVEVGSLRLSVLCPTSYPVQAFEDHNVALLERVHELSAHLVENGACPPPLLRAEPSQPAPGRLRAFGLKGGAQSSKVLPSGEGGLALDFETVGSHEQIVHPDVYSYRIVSLWIWNLSLDGNMQEEPLVFVGKHGMGRLDTFEQFLLVFAYFKRGLDALLNRCDGGMPPIGLLEHPEESSIEVERELVEAEELVSSSLVSFGHPISRTDCEVGREPELGPSFAVDDVVEGDGIEDSTLKSHPRNVIAGIPKRLDGAEQLCVLLICEPELADYGLDEPHRNSIYAFSLKNLPQFLPALTDGVSLRWSR